MKINKVIASDFGCLSGEYSLFDDRANVVVEANERGKSTLVAAILAGLYGLPPSRERKRLPEAETYRPWKAGPYRVQLEVEDDHARPLLIERDFDSGKTKVTDLSTNKNVTKEFRAGKTDFAIGDRLLGISREVFIKTCLVRQLEVENVGEKSDELVSKVQRIFDSPSGKGTAAGAINVLKGAIRDYRGKLLQQGKVETEISRLREAIEQREAQIQELIEEREKAAPSMNRLRKLRDRLETLEVRRQQLECLTRNAEIGETESLLKEDGDSRRALDKLMKRRESLKPYSDFTKEEAGDFAKLAGRLDALRKQRTQVENSLADLKKNLEAARAKLNEYDGLKGLGEELKTRLHDLCMELKRLGEEADKKRRELSEFEESLQKGGYDLSESEALYRRFSRLTDEENDLLRRCESRVPEIERDIVKAGGHEKRCREELRATKKPTRVLLLVGGILCAGAIVGIVLSAAAIGLALLAGGAAALAVALLLTQLKKNRRHKLLTEQQAARKEREALIVERQRLTQKLDEMAPRAGVETVVELTETFRRWGPLEGRAKRLESLRTDTKAEDEKLASCKGRACDVLKKMALQVSPADVGLALLENAENRVGEYLKMISSLKQMEERRKSLEESIKKLDQEGKGLQDHVRHILSSAKLPQDLPPEKALAKVEEAREKSEEFHRLATKQIPDKRRSLLSSEKTSAMKRRLQSLKVEIEKRLTEKPELAKLETVKTHSQYEEEARRIAAEIAENTDERGRIAREVQNVEDKYREQYPTLANELADLKETFDRAERFQKSVLIAIETLQEVSTKSHARWAGTLNERTNEILRHLNPRCRELKFDRDLSFTVVPADGAQPLDRMRIEAQQSVGARHQIYLAVRLALSDYLSSAGKKVPVILDDPFATSDDDRFLSGMKFLCRDFRRNHQVIILTCHRQRHTDLLRQEAPDLLDDLRIVQLTPC